MGGGTDQDIVIWQYALNASWVLLPLVPAVIIYLIFPKTEVGLSGPFTGLSVRASGAFAAYFVILLATFPLLNRQNRNIESLLDPTWKILGSVRVEDSDGVEISYGRDGGPLVITPDPDPVGTGSQNSNNYDIAVPEINNKIPSLAFKYTGFGEVTIDPKRPPEGVNVEIDENSHTVSISPIVIRKVASCEGICSGT